METLRYWRERSWVRSRRRSSRRRIRAALTNWLQTNNYPVPMGVQPILDAYVAEGFGFLAVKLLPGQGSDAVKPIRVTFDGAVPSFPMRLLNAGRAARPDVTLFALADGRYEPSGAPTFTINPEELTWDYAAEKSDYEAVRAAKLAAAGGTSLLVEYARPTDSFLIDTPLTEFVSSDPKQGGYGGDPMKSAQQLLQEDLAALHGSLGGASGGAPWIMRFVGTLSKEALRQGLTLTAAASQTELFEQHRAREEGERAGVPALPVRVRMCRRAGGRLFGRRGRRHRRGALANDWLAAPRRARRRPAPQEGITTKIIESGPDGSRRRRRRNRGSQRSGRRGGSCSRSSTTSPRGRRASARCPLYSRRRPGEGRAPRRRRRFQAGGYQGTSRGRCQRALALQMLVSPGNSLVAAGPGRARWLWRIQSQDGSNKSPHGKKRSSTPRAAFSHSSSLGSLHGSPVVSASQRV